MTSPSTDLTAVLAGQQRAGHPLRGLRGASARRSARSYDDLRAAPMNNEAAGELLRLAASRPGLTDRVADITGQVTDWAFTKAWAEREEIRTDGIAAVGLSRRSSPIVDDFAFRMAVGVRCDDARDTLRARIEETVRERHRDRLTGEFAVAVARAAFAGLEGQAFGEQLRGSDDRWLRWLCATETRYLLLRKLCGHANDTTAITRLLDTDRWQTIIGAGLRTFCDLRHLPYQRARTFTTTRARYDTAAFWARERMRESVGYQLSYLVGGRWPLLELLCVGSTAPWRPTLTLAESDSTSPHHRS